jgi:hypothetical protein
MITNGSDRAQGPASSKISFEEAWQLIVRMGVAAHRYGSTAIRLEAFLGLLSKRLGYPGVFRSTPSDIVFAVREGPESPRRVEVSGTPIPGLFDGIAMISIGSTARCLTRTAAFRFGLPVLRGERTKTKTRNRD